MKALAFKPKNDAQRLRRSIALVLDNALVGGKDGTMRLHPMMAQDMDELVERLAQAAETFKHPWHLRQTKYGQNIYRGNEKVEGPFEESYDALMRMATLMDRQRDELRKGGDVVADTTPTP